MSLQLVERGLERSGLPLEPCAWPFRSRLTVKLRGRTTTPDRRCGGTLSPGARGAKPLTHHGPLQRLLGIKLPTQQTLTAENTDEPLRRLSQQQREAKH